MGAFYQVSEDRRVVAYLLREQLELSILALPLERFPEDWVEHHFSF